MVEILVDVFIISFIYVLPIVVFIKYLGNTNCKNYLKFFFIIIYVVGIILTSSFMDNLFPFIFVVLSVLILRIDGYKDDYNIYNFSPRKTNFIRAFEYFILFYVINIAVVIIFQWVFSKFNVAGQQQEIVKDMENMRLFALIRYVPVSVIFAPILEEFIFRFVLFEKIFKNKIGVYLGCIVSSILFSILHYNLEAFPVLFALAVENCYLIHKKGFWYSLLNHSLFNFITVASILADKIK